MLTAALDHTVVVTVLPEVMPDLKVPPTELDQAAWIITAYLLGFTAAIPVTARLADIYGHVRLYQISLIIFGAGSLAAALAPNLDSLIAARAVQAVGGGATIPVGMAMAGARISRQAAGGRRRHNRGVRRGRNGAGPTLWRCHHESLGLAVGVLAGHPADRHPDLAASRLPRNSPTQHPYDYLGSALLVTRPVRFLFRNGARRNL